MVERLSIFDEGFTEETYGDSSDALNFLADVVESRPRFDKEGFEIDINTLLLDETSCEQWTGGISVARETGQYHVHPTGARAEMEQFYPEKGEPAVLPESFMDEQEVIEEIASYLTYSSKDASRAVLAMLGRAPKVVTEQVRTQKAEMVAARKAAKVTGLFEVSFDTTEFEKSINKFEKYVASCFESKKLWESVVDVVFDEDVVYVHLEDALRVFLERTSADKEEIKSSSVIGTTTCRLVCWEVERSVIQLQRMVDKLNDAVRFGIAETGFVVGVHNIENSLRALKLNAQRGLASIESVRVPMENLNILQSFLNEIALVGHMAIQLRRVFNKAVSPHYFMVAEILTVLVFSLETLNQAIISRINLIQSNMRMAVRESDESTKSAVTEAFMGHLEGLKKNIWQSEIISHTSVDKIPMYRFSTSGFSQRFMRRLKELGVASEFAVALRDIFAEADVRAVKVFERFADQHFYFWGA